MLKKRKKNKTTTSSFYPPFNICKFFFFFGGVKNMVLGNISISRENTQHVSCKSLDKIMDNSHKPLSCSTSQFLL